MSSSSSSSNSELSETGINKIPETHSVYSLAKSYLPRWKNGKLCVNKYAQTEVEPEYSTRSGTQPISNIIRIDQETQTTAHRIVYKYKLVPMLEDANANDSLVLGHDKNGIFVEVDKVNHNDIPGSSKGSFLSSNTNNNKQNFYPQSLPNTLDKDKIIYNFQVETVGSQNSNVNSEPQRMPSHTDPEKAQQTDLEIENESPANASPTATTVTSGSEISQESSAVSSTGYLADNEISSEDDDTSSFISSINQEHGSDVSMNITLLSPPTSAYEMATRREINRYSATSSRQNHLETAGRCEISQQRSKHSKSNPPQSQQRTKIRVKPIGTRSQPQLGDKKPQGQ